jgi:preprotein translocase subunit SecY
LVAQANPAAAIQNIYRTPELWQKIVFTFVCLLLYRAGAHITVPGVDVQALTNYFANQRGGGSLLGLYDLFVGGGLSRATVFALGIMPYISASIFVQIGGAVVPQVDKMQKDEEGRKKLTQWTRYLTVALAAVQGYGFALFTQGLPGAVGTPGFWSFVVPMVLVLVTGAVFVMWLGEQITERGLGNGASLLIFFSIVERFWPGILDTFRFVTTGAVAPLALLVLGLAMIGVVAGVVAITVAARRVMVQIPQKTMARGRQREAAKNFIPLRINTAGVMPIIFAQSVIVVPGAAAQFFPNNAVARNIADALQPGTWLYFLLSAILIVLFTYFYTSIIFNPVDLAENLKKQGGFVPGVRPGAKTAEYIEQVVERITFPGALFLAAIALLPIAIARMVNVPFQFGGTSLLIVVGVALDTMTQMQQHLLLRKYDGFMKKGRVRRYGGGAPGSAGAAL